MNKVSAYQWCVVGAGPAGILMIGKLLDQGIDPKSILWLDPDFKVGDLGCEWQNVPSNTRVVYFNEFLSYAKSFDYESCPDNCSIRSLNEGNTCILGNMANTLQWVSDHLSEKVVSIKAKVNSLNMFNACWNIKTDEKIFSAKRVVVAVGAEPIELNEYPELPTVSLKKALDPEKLKTLVSHLDHVAVFGSSHSAVLILKALNELGIKATNFYRSPIRYAVQLDDCILYDNTGLKGTTAEWARKHLSGELPENLERVNTNDQHFKEKLKACNKAIYAVGFNRRTIAIDGQLEISHDPKTGIIAPGLYGLGLAYPELVVDKFGREEWNVGLFKFSNYLEKVFPLWLLYPI
jgi:pyruvate/2-oxoglutarate dehydrogenase complex dihydrolipoamide dehydrogenase (E3) component